MVDFGVLGLDQTLLFHEDPLGGYWLLVLGSQRTRDIHFLTPPPFCKPVTDVKLCNAEDIGGARYDSTVKGKDTCQELIPW